MMSSTRFLGRVPVRIRDNSGTKKKDIVVPGTSSPRRCQREKRKKEEELVGEETLVEMMKEDGDEIQNGEGRESQEEDLIGESFSRERGEMKAKAKRRKRENEEEEEGNKNLSIKRRRRSGKVSVTHSASTNDTSMGEQEKRQLENWGLPKQVVPTNMMELWKVQFELSKIFQILSRYLERGVSSMFEWQVEALATGNVLQGGTGRENKRMSTYTINMTKILLLL